MFRTPLLLAVCLKITFCFVLPNIPCRCHDSAMSQRTGRGLESREILDADYETTKQGDSRALYEKKILNDEGKDNNYDVYDVYEQQHTSVFVEEQNTVIDHVSEEDKEKQRQWEEEQRAYEEHIMKSYQMAENPLDQQTEEEKEKQRELEEADRFYQQHLEALRRRLREQNAPSTNLTGTDEENQEQVENQNHLRFSHGRFQKADNVEESELLEEKRVHNSEKLSKERSQIDEMKRKMAQKTKLYKKELECKDKQISSLQSKLKAAEQQFPKESETSYNISQTLEKTRIQTEEMKQNSEKRRNEHEKELSRKDKEIISLKEKLKSLIHQQKEDQRLYQVRQGKEEQRASKEQQLSHHVNETIRMTQRQLDELTENMRRRSDIYNRTLAQKNERILSLERRLAEAEKKSDVDDSPPRKDLLVDKISQIVQDTQRHTKEMRESIEQRRAVYEKEIARKDERIALLEESLQIEERRRDMKFHGIRQAKLATCATQIVNEIKNQQNHQVGQISCEIQVELDKMKHSIKEKRRLYEKELTDQEKNIASIEEKYRMEFGVMNRALAKTTENLLKKLNDDNANLHTALDTVKTWETIAVYWEIPEFVSNSGSDSTTVFKSQTFSILNHTMTLELHIMHPSGTNEESDRYVGIFFKHEDDCSLLTMEAMEGSVVTITGINTTSINLFGTSCDFVYESHHCRFGWKHIATLEDIIRSCVSAEGSLNIEASLRTKQMKRYDVSREDR